MTSSYLQTLRKLYSMKQFHPNKIGLQSMMKMNEILSNPLKDIPVIHVAGTNGKGSVSIKIAEAIRRSGVITGLYISPHLSSFRERISVDGNICSEESVVDCLNKLFSICESEDIPATFFELTTALSFMHFRNEHCKAVVLEVGLGGRLDATNIINPELCIITSIDYDHMKILGNTLEEIALEKAGIMKPGVKVLVGPGCPLHVMEKRAKEIGAIYYQLQDVLSDDDMDLLAKTNNLNNSPTDTNLLNSMIAKAALFLLRNPSQYQSKSDYVSPKSNSSTNSLFSRLSDGDILNGIMTTQSCRYEIFNYNWRKCVYYQVNPYVQWVKISNTYAKVDKGIETSLSESGKDWVTVILDIAHNEAAMTTLVKRLKRDYSNRSFRFVVGMSSDKEVRLTIAPLLSAVNGEYLSRIMCTAANHYRAVSPSELATIVKDVATEGKALNTTTNIEGNLQNTESKLDNVCPSVIEALMRAISLARTSQNNDNDIVVVCGTSFIMAEARAALGIIEARENDELNDYLVSKK